MRKSYIAKSAEALNLHNGTQTAIVVKMKVQPIRVSSGYYDISISKGKYGFCAYGTLISNILKNPLFLRCAPYQIGQEVYVRETIVCNALAGAIYKAGGKVYAGMELSEDEYIGIDYLDKSDRGFIPLCKEKHARTRFKIVGCEVVRVKEFNLGHIIDMVKEDVAQKHNPLSKENLISKFGQSAWDNNDYIWYYKIEKI